jgi:hypothetical protein
LKFRQSILEKLDQLQTNNPKEYWTLVNSRREKSNDRPEKCIDDNEWYTYFALLKTSFFFKKNFQIKVKPVFVLMSKFILCFFLFSDQSLQQCV